MPSTMDKLAAGAKGGEKEVKATLKGLSGVFMHLMEEHGKVGALLKRVKGSSDRGVQADLYPEIRKDLLAHEKGEIEVVYPAIAEHAEMAGIAERHSQEARELEAAIGEVDREPIGSDGWKSAFNRLVDLVEKHVDEEESQFFPAAQKAIGSERAKELLPQFEATKRV